MCLTNSEFSATLLDSAGAANRDTTIQGASVKCSLNLDVPFFKKVGIEDLMTERADGAAFELFRQELEKQVRELRAETDPEKRRIKLENAMHELTEVQRTRIDQSITHLRRKLLGDAAIAVGGLVGTLASGFSLLATMAGAAQGYKTLVEMNKAVRESPAYFLWKAQPK